MALHLQDGGIYRDSLGDEVEVALAYPGDEFPFVRTNGDPMRYTADGRYIDGELALAVAVYNLVEEVLGTDL